MIGPPALKLRIKKFLSNSASGAATVDGVVLAVVVAGDVAAVTGVMPATGEIAAAAGLAIMAGDAREGGAGGGDWPKEVSTSVMEQKLAISSVFIEVIGKFFRPEFPMRICALFILKEISASPAKLSRLSFRRFRIWRATNFIRIIRPFGL